VASVLASLSALGQNYPTRPVRVVVPLSPGGFADTPARILAPRLSEQMGKQFFIENRPGAGGTIGTEAVVRSAPDGYTLLLVDTSNTFNVTLYEHLNFNFIRDIAPVAGIFRGASLLVRHPSFPAASVPELISYAKANPGKVTMASAGIGSIPHVAGELFKILAGVDIVQVQYRGSGPALVDMLGGQTQVTFATVPSSIEYVRAGRLLPLAVTSARRLDILPDVPTVSEFVRGYEITAWTGLGAPKGTPAGIIDRLNKETNAALADAKMKARFAELGGVAIPGPPADFARFIAGEAERWGKVIRTANIKPE
jgi:tripartite-type tricarboxylate transporter receptor subunit TctC